MFKKVNGLSRWESFLQSWITYKNILKFDLDHLDQALCKRIQNTEWILFTVYKFLLKIFIQTNTVYSKYTNELYNAQDNKTCDT